jgi:hypothetical protein
MKISATIALFIGLAVSGNASAQEVVLSGNGTTANNPYLVLVADGCGWGWYRGPGGACHRNGFGPGYAGPNWHAGWVGPGGAWHPGFGWRGGWVGPGGAWHPGWRGCGWRCRHW